MEGFLAYKFKEFVDGYGEAIQAISNTSKSPSSMFGNKCSNMYCYEDLLVSSGNASSGGAH
jgi:hypothetical protein